MEKIKIIRDLQDRADEILDLIEDKESEIDVIRQNVATWKAFEFDDRVQKLNKQIQGKNKSIEKLFQSYKLILNQITEQC